MGTWIEIADQGRRHDGNHVVPLVGTWIEMYGGVLGVLGGVVPLVGTWIEMSKNITQDIMFWSCPSWARGLKLANANNSGGWSVVPLVGTWIEIWIH